MELQEMRHAGNYDGCRQHDKVPELRKTNGSNVDKIEEWMKWLENQTRQDNDRLHTDVIIVTLPQLNTGL